MYSLFLKHSWMFNNNNIIIKLYSHIQPALHDELECSLALTHIVPIYQIWQINIRYRYKIYSVHTLFFKMKQN